jgi:SAM-dependent methyltransferase
VIVRTPPLRLTGERTVPGVWHENYWFRRHEVVYAACREWVTQAPSMILDAGSGEGYGTARLAHDWPGAHSVGIDYNPQATTHATAVHGGRHTAYLRAALTSVPLPTNGFDLVVSLQTIEHIWSPGDYVRELLRVCRPGATVVLSTPNRLTFSPGLGRRAKPDNVFHSREYDATELVGELGRWAPGLVVERVLGLRHGPRLAAWETSHGPIARAQLSAAPQDWPEPLAGMVASVTVGDFTLSPDTLDESLDLVLVARAR